MKKNKSINNAVQANVWDAHIARANSSVAARKEYKRSNYELNAHKINAQRIIDGQNVGECWLKGKLKEELIELGYCKRSDFSKYNRPNGSINIG